MAFVFPENIKKGVDLTELDEYSLIYWHDKMHILWQKISEGLVIPEWDFISIHAIHEEVLGLMMGKGIPHLHPINSLDIVTNDEDKVTKFNTDNLISIEKKGEEVKILSKDGEDLTKKLYGKYKDIHKSLLNLHKENFAALGNIEGDSIVLFDLIEYNGVNVGYVPFKQRVKYLNNFYFDERIKKNEKEIKPNKD